MGSRLNNQHTRRGAVRRGQIFAVSSFTIFLLGFALSYWMVHFFTLATAVECEYAIMWLSGWFDYRAPFQWLAVAITALAIVWLLRVFTRRPLNKGETAFQLVFILGLCAAFLAQKAFLFPYGAPSRAQLERIMPQLMPSNVWLLDEMDEIEIDMQANWPFDYPPPPSAAGPEHPLWNDAIALRMTDLFRDRYSPLYSEYRHMQTCYANYQDAVAQYERDLENWYAYWAGFNEWYADNSWRYPDDPGWRVAPLR